MVISWYIVAFCAVSECLVSSGLNIYGQSTHTSLSILTLDSDKESDIKHADELCASNQGYQAVNDLFCRINRLGRGHSCCYKSLKVYWRHLQC